MALKTSLTGSYPPIKAEKPNRQLSEPELDSLVYKSIQRAVKDQIELGIDILVDGQVRDDIVSIFCRHIPGFSGSTLPYRVVGPIRPAEQSITVSDYLTAKEFAGGKPIKVHVTGPMTIVRGSVVDPESGYSDKTDPQLVMDVASALGQEVRYLVKAGANIVQIDEPVLADGTDLDLAFRAMEKIVKIGEIPFPALHACGNVCGILGKVLTQAPVKAVSIEGIWLKREELVNINRDSLLRSGKKIGLGCISVSDYKVEKLRTVENFIDQMIHQLGEENIWAIMPNCGLRLMPIDTAREKLSVMTAAARKFG